MTKLRELLTRLPPFCTQFFIGIEPTTAPLTRLNYARDLQIFFDYLITETADFNRDTVRDLTLDDMARVKALHIEYFLSYVTYYTVQKDKRTNGERGKARKLASIRSFFKFLYKKDLIPQNVSEKIDTPKLHDREIIRLDSGEVTELLSEVESGDKLSAGERRFHKCTHLRDEAILTLFLGTGIRISELVGLNMDDVDFKLNSFAVTRKGGNRTVLYFSPEVSGVLQAYLEERLNNPKYKDINDPALFLSLQGRRISTRAVQDLVKKHSRGVTQKHITPHKLRSTFGTELYRQTHDIYIVADVLGHSDVNTTRKHYAAISEDMRKAVASAVSLRKDEDE